MRTVASLCALTAVTVWGLMGQSKYDGPRPPKQDVPYLLHAAELVETETLMAKEEDRKKDHVASIEGKSSAVQTPLAEPIFLFDAGKVDANKLQLFRMEQTRDGRREIVLPDIAKKGKKPLQLVVKKLSGNLYRVEADEVLANGEYCLSPEGASVVHCFSIY
jgi:hypothetical protein